MIGCAGAFTPSVLNRSQVRNVGFGFAWIKDYYDIFAVAAGEWHQRLLLCDFLSRLLVIDPRGRMTAAQVLNSCCLAGATCHNITKLVSRAGADAPLHLRGGWGRLASGCAHRPLNTGATGA